MLCHTNISKLLYSILYSMALDFIYNIINIMKLSPAKGSIWAGALRYVLTVLVAALVTAIVTLALGVVYGIKLAQAPLSPYDVKYQGAHKYFDTVRLVDPELYTMLQY